VRGRALVVWLLRTLPSRPMSYPEIGKVLGGMDHQSMIHLHRKAIYLRLRDRVFASACKSFHALLSERGGFACPPLKPSQSRRSSIVPASTADP
jgi:hypothetical protein